MNSQRLEEIVAELMKPISSDGRRSFDTDLSTLLEEYLTEAGLHALEAEDESPGGGAGSAGAAVAVAPNFAEIALLLQQSANIYGRKVDFLYKHVLSVSDSLLQSTQELNNESAASLPAAEEAQTPSRRRKRRLSAGDAVQDFAPIALEECPGAARDVEAPRPPPTLPRMYAELLPRAPHPADLPLLDYAAENIGLLSDFQVTWRLHEGLLVDELEGGCMRGRDSLRPISLLELQAAIEAAAPPLPPSPVHPPSPPHSPARASSPLAASTPLPMLPAPPLDATQATAVTVKRERKRCSNVKVDDIFNGSVNIVFGKDLMRKLKEVREFTVDKRWIKRVVHKRKRHILSERRRLADELEEEPGGTHEGRPPDKGFTGWSGAEAAVSYAELRSWRDRDRDDTDSDDGFFEQSSGGSSVQSGEPDPLGPSPGAAPAAAEAEAWKTSILRRAAAAEARPPLDVHALGARVLRALDAHEHAPRPLPLLLRDHVRHKPDVSHVLLATLFLANAGNVEIVQGPPLSLDSCGVRLLSRDMRRFKLAATEDELMLR